MTGKEFLEAIDRLGLSQSGAARFLDYNPRTIRRWVSGEHEIPWVIELLFWSLKRCKTPIYEIPRKDEIYLKIAAAPPVAMYGKKRGRDR